MLSPEKRAEFEALAKPLIKFINDNGHPHMHILIDCESAELSEGLYCARTKEFIPD